MRTASGFVFCIFLLSSAKYSFAGSGLEPSALEPVIRPLQPVLDVFKNVLSGNGETEKTDTEKPHESEPEPKPAPKTSSCQQCDDKSVAFYAAEDETWTLSLTGALVRVTPGSKTNGTVTGGAVFGKDLFKFSHFRLDWKHCVDKIEFEAVICYFKTEYESIENAVKHYGGIAQVTVPIEANGNKHNSKFDEMNNQMKKIKKPGDSTQIHSIDSFSWFKNFPPDTPYKYFDSTYFDEDSGQNYNCSINVRLPLEPHENYISIEQFYTAFAHLKDKSGDDLKSNMPPKDTPLSSPKKEKGIDVISI